jgi:ferritin-like metal-binding protein YciE
MTQLTGNVGSVERWISTLCGAGLALVAFQRGTVLQRAAAGVAGLSLLTRGATGYCAVKDALGRGTSAGNGVTRRGGRESLRTRDTRAVEIDSLHTLYVDELQEVRSAEAQLQSFLPSLLESFRSSALEQLLRQYQSQGRARIESLERIIPPDAGNAGGHSDEAMRALIVETGKMTRIEPTHVRGAALIASLQRLIHFMIAGYGSVATYAITLGRPEEAECFDNYVEQEKEMDHHLTALAKAIANPEARAHP